MNSGTYRDHVTVQKKTETQDALGGVVEAWEIAFTRWANIQPLTGKEVFEADQLQTRQSHKIRTRFTSEISTQHRIAYQSRLFLIKSVRNPDERQRVTELGCMEEGI